MKEVSSGRLPFNESEHQVHQLVREIQQADAKLLTHSLNVGTYAEQLARLAGIPYQQREAIVQAGQLHDVGKLEEKCLEIWKRPLGSKWSEEDKQIMSSHPTAGMQRANEKGVNLEICKMIATHHENFDGSGYPFKLKGDDIPRGSQIIRIADSFSAIMERSGKSAYYAEDSILEQMGSTYNPNLIIPFRYFAEVWRLKNK